MIRAAIITIVLAIALPSSAFAELKTYVQYDPLTGIITGTITADASLPPPEHGFLKQIEVEGAVEVTGQKVDIFSRSLEPRQTKVVEIMDNGKTKQVEVYADDAYYKDEPALVIEPVLPE